MSKGTFGLSTSPTQPRMVGDFTKRQLQRWTSRSDGPTELLGSILARGPVCGSRHASLRAANPLRRSTSVGSHGRTKPGGGNGRQRPERRATIGLSSQTFFKSLARTAYPPVLRPARRGATPTVGPNDIPHFDVWVATGNRR